MVTFATGEGYCTGDCASGDVGVGALLLVGVIAGVTYKKKSLAEVGSGEDPLIFKSKN